MSPLQGGHLGPGAGPHTVLGLRSRDGVHPNSLPSFSSQRRHVGVRVEAPVPGTACRQGLANVVRDQLVKIWGFGGHTFPVTSVRLRQRQPHTATDGYVTAHSRAPVQLHVHDLDGGFGPQAVALPAPVPGDGSVCRSDHSNFLTATRGVFEMRFTYLRTPPFQVCDPGLLACSQWGAPPGGLSLRNPPCPPPPAPAPTSLSSSSGHGTSAESHNMRPRVSGFARSRPVVRVGPRVAGVSTALVFYGRVTLQYV